MNNTDMPRPVNPLLERVVIPGETFRLPSGGLFYKDGELDSSVTGGEVQVNPLTALDEIVMKSPDKIINGKAITEVFVKCMPQVIKPGQLFAKDVDYLMLCLRKVTYGDTITVTFDHGCKDSKSHEYTTTLTKFINSAKQIDPTTINSLYTVTLPNGQVVKLHPVKFDNIMSMMQVSSMSMDDHSAEQIQRELFKTVVSVIASVDEVTDKDFIMEWATTIQTMWFDQIKEAVDKSSDWGPTTEFKTTCQDCGQEVEISVPLNPLVFFTR